MGPEQSGDSAQRSAGGGDRAEGGEVGSSNENIFGSSPLAAAAFAEAASKLNMYPDGRATALRAAIAERYRIEPERLVLGCGTDEILGRMVQQVYLELD